MRNEIKFNGFIVTDWLAASTEQSVNSIEVGIDVLGGAPSRLSNAADVIASVGIDRINDAARRVLETKIRLGMFENPFGNPSARNPEHHALALEAARKVITLLKNDNDVLPLNLDAADELVVAGPRSRWMNRDNDPNVIWQSIYYNNDQAKSYVQAIKDRATPEGIQVFQQDTYSPDNPAEDVNRGDDVPGATNPKVAVIVIGEKSYTHGTSWDDKNPDIPGYQLDVIRKYKDAGAKVVTVVLLPRPYVLTQVEELSDAILAVYRGGNGIGQAVAECIFGDFAPTGKLPFQLPRSQEQIGTDDEKNQIEKWDLPYDLGATDSERAMIRSYIGQDLPVPPIFGDPLFQYGHGMQGFGIVDDPPSSSSFVKEKDEIQIYPNPFKDEFTAHLKGITGDHLKVLDIAGKVIAVKPVNSDIVHFNFPDCQPGLYLLVLTGNNGTKVTKLIKE